MLCFDIGLQSRIIWGTIGPTPAALFVVAGRIDKNQVQYWTCQWQFHIGASSFNEIRYSTLDETTPARKQWD